MSLNSFESLPDDRAPAILRECQSPYIDAFVTLYEDTLAVAANGAPITAKSIPRLWKKDETIQAPSDNEGETSDIVRVKFYGADQNVVPNGRPWLRRLVTIQINPADFVLRSLARDDLGYRMHTDASSTLQLQIDANTQPYKRNESKLFDLGWSLTTVEGTTTSAKNHDARSELTVVESFISLGNNIHGDLSVFRPQTTRLQFIKTIVDGDESMQSERTRHESPVSPESMLQESKILVLDPATRLLQAISLAARLK